jgi:hypothetical protein
MKPATPMTSPFHHPIDTARRAVSRERARPERKRGPEHRLKILAGVFHRRHILATYDTYE